MDLFAGEGIGALLVGAVMLLIAGATMVWLLGPGNRLHDPPVARRQVVLVAAGFAIVAVGQGIRSFWGFGGVLVASVFLLAALGTSAIVRARQNRP